MSFIHFLMKGIIKLAVAIKYIYINTFIEVYWTVCVGFTTNHVVVSSSILNDGFIGIIQIWQQTVLLFRSYMYRMKNTYAVLL